MHITTPIILALAHRSLAAWTLTFYGSDSTCATGGKSTAGDGEACILTPGTPGGALQYLQYTTDPYPDGFFANFYSSSTCNSAEGQGDVAPDTCIAYKPGLYVGIFNTM